MVRERMFSMCVLGQGVGGVVRGRMFSMYVLGQGVGVWSGEGCSLCVYFTTSFHLSVLLMTL